MVEIAIALPETLQVFLEQQLSEGTYANASAYLCALLERERQRLAQEALDRALLTGLESADHQPKIVATDQWWEQKRADWISEYK